MRRTRTLYLSIRPLSVVDRNNLTFPLLSQEELTPETEEGKVEATEAGW
jgi:hypothetical protein